MSIKYAILGLLSWRPLSGYDLKKIIADSLSFYWSGNNNQIYKTLVQLHTEGLVESEVQQQENYPTRKEYNITERGAAELRNWVLSAPELTQFRNTFLIQLAWADQLDGPELDGLLARYAREVEMQLLILQERERRGGLNPARTPREEYLWREISSYFVTAYANELAWVRALRLGLARYDGGATR
jgi:PadR family transcriptional regulator, regulatory protein AphA